MTWLIHWWSNVDSPTCKFISLLFLPTLFLLSSVGSWTGSRYIFSLPEGKTKPKYASFSNSRKGSPAQKPAADPSWFSSWSSSSCWGGARCAWCRAPSGSCYSGPATTTQQHLPCVRQAMQQQLIAKTLGDFCRGPSCHAQSTAIKTIVCHSHILYFHRLTSTCFSSFLTNTHRSQENPIFVILLKSVCVPKYLL